MYFSLDKIDYRNPTKNRKSLKKIKIEKQTISKIKLAALSNSKKANSRAQVFSKIYYLKTSFKNKRQMVCFNKSMVY